MPKPTGSMLRIMVLKTIVIVPTLVLIFTRLSERPVIAFLLALGFVFACDWFAAFALKGDRDSG